MRKKTKLRGIFAAMLVLSLLTASVVPVSAAGDAVAQAKNGVVELIMGYTLESGSFLELAYGSAFLINDHAVLTCYHCVVADETIEQYIVEQTGKEFKNDRIGYRVVVSGDVTRTATVWPDAYSQQNDWAVLKLSDTINGRTPLALGDSSTAEAKDVYALGFPDSALSDIPKYTSDDVTLTNGVVSKLTQTDGKQSLQHSAQISAGSSGGPLVDENGVVLGINYGGTTADGANYSYYALQINEVKTVLDALNVDYTDAAGTSAPAAAVTTTEPEATEVKEDTEPEATETVAPEPTLEPVQEPTVTEQPEVQAEEEPVEEESSNTALILAIVGSVLLIVVVVVVVIVVAGGKKKQQPAARSTAPVGTRPNVGAPASPTAGGVPVAPFATSGSVRPAAPSYSTESIGATTVLGGDGGAGETTVLGGGASASLVRSKNNETTRITRNEFVVGKERSKVDYCIADNSSISRRHAKIMARGGRYYLVDLGSTNCTYVNGAKSAPNTETEITNGDKIKFADEEFIFHC